MSAAVHEDYLPDLTRPCCPSQGTTAARHRPSTWDSNAAAMEENGTLHYYLQDEMGSPSVSAAMTAQTVWQTETMTPQPLTLPTPTTNSAMTSPGRFYTQNMIAGNGVAYDPE